MKTLSHRQLFPLIGFLVILGVAVVAPLTQHSPDSATATTAKHPLAKKGGWHTVLEGETLRSIARDYYGHTAPWRQLQLTNDVTMAPAPGSILWIPADRTAHEDLVTR